MRQETTRSRSFPALLLFFLLCASLPGLATAADFVPEFDGFSNYIEIPHHEALDPGNESWTLEFRVKLLEEFSGGSTKFIAKRDGSGSAGGFYIGSRFAPVCSDGNRRNLDFRNRIPVGEWVHIAAQVDRENDRIRVLVNGEVAGETDSRLTGAVRASSSLVIGGDSTGGLQGNHCRIRDVRIWKGVNLSVEEVRALMVGPVSPDAPGLAGSWPLDEGSGDRARDLGPHGNHGVFAGRAAWVPATDPFSSNLPGTIEIKPGDSITLGPVELKNPVGEVTWQWFFENRPLEGATRSTLEIENITAHETGAYHVMVDDAREFTPIESARARLVEPDWPMWRFDPARSAATPHRLAENLHLQWTRELPAPERAWPFQWDDQGKFDFDLSWAPVVKGDRIFVPSSSTDSVTAYAIDDGAEIWRFHANGPVRLAPAAWRGSIYFTSDDGHLYCLDAETGALKWKFRGGPGDRHLLGNERIINFWPARGGALVDDGLVYFTAGIWPRHGIFIHALDAVTGDPVWTNDTTSSDYMELPHGGADGFGALAPQGYLAIDGDRLIVSGGRTHPAFFSRKTGEFDSMHTRTAKGSGGYAVNALSADGLGKAMNEMLSERLESVADQVDGEVFYKLAARDRLFLTTLDGKIYCFGPEPREPARHEFKPAPLAVPGGGSWADTARGIINALGENEGYALLLGAGSGALLDELLLGTGLRVTVVESDPEKVASLRRKLVSAGLYGRRAAVIEADPATFTVQPYLFSLVLSEDLSAAGIKPSTGALETILDRLRPYGGVAWLGFPAGQSGPVSAAAATAQVDRVTVDVIDSSPLAALFARRDGPLTGAGEWTHQYHDSANTLLSRDSRVRMPLGILWYGGPSNHNILPRHSAGPRPQVTAGRQVFLGVETIGARCVYTGRQLWEREFPGIGHPFTNLELEEIWRGGRQVYMTNIPGATYIGSPFVTLPDSIYLRHGGMIHRLDTAGGRTLDRFPLPGRPVAEIYGAGAPDWGHLSVRGDFLVTTTEPHLFEDQALGWTDSYSGTSSRRLAVMNRFTGELLWEREARVGFRHTAIVSDGKTLFLVDGLSENALEQLARRGIDPQVPSIITALDLETGAEKWQAESQVFGTFLLYSADHDILLEGGSADGRRRLADEPGRVAARSGEDGRVLWTESRFTMPAAVRGDMIIPGRPGVARSILTGEAWQRVQEGTGFSENWSYQRRYGCNTINASENLLLFRTGYAGFYDLEHESGTGNFSGFRSGCTANMIAADGVLNALDYTRTCGCNYAQQTSLALIHMPDDPYIEDWTLYAADPPATAGHGINFGAPGRRVDISSGLTWHDRPGTARRHASAIRDAGPSLPWVAASGLEMAGDGKVSIADVTAGSYRLRLHFADLNPGAGPGRRVFDIVLNGNTVLAGFDIAAAAGGAFRGTTAEFTASTAGEPLQIELRASPGSELAPFLNGVEITRQ